MVDRVAPVNAATPAPGAPWAERHPAHRAAAAGLAIWTVVVSAAVLWPQISALDPAADISAAPFYGHWASSIPAAMLAAVAIGLVAVIGLPRLCAAVTARWLPVVAGAAGVGWALTLAVSGGGWARVASPLNTRHEYLPLASHIHPANFLRTFVARADHYPTHVKGHPPGAVLLFWLLNRIGLGGPGWAAVVVLGAWGVGVAAVVWTVGRVAGRESALRAAPFVALVPAVIWAATTVDALIAGVTAAGIALIVSSIGATDRPWRHDALAFSGGVVGAAALYLSYGVAPLMLIPLAVAARRRRIRPLLFAAAGALAVAAAFTRAGFWWFDGLSATRGFYAQGLARVRPYAYFVVAGNLGALALAAGPATAAGFGRLAAPARRHPELLVIGAALVAVLIVDVSGMSKGEVERIWLPFTIWLAAAGGSASSTHSNRTTSFWLTVQVVLALALQAWLVTPW